jgi:hypothetical protein
MHRLTKATVAMALLLVALPASTAAAGHRHSKPAKTKHARTIKRGFARVTFVEHAKRRRAGSQPASALSTDFHVSKHPLGESLTYHISTSGCTGSCTGAANSVNAGFSDWSVSGLTLSQSGSADTNPCTNQPDSVSWAPIDGPGGTLAATSVCVQLGHNGRIVGFDTVFDSGDHWSTCGSVSACHSAASGQFSIQAVAAHESGHAYGLEHDKAPRDSRLTMFYGIAPNDFGFATLGCGDRLGVNALYGTSLTCAGVPQD